MVSQQDSTSDKINNDTSKLRVYFIYYCQEAPFEGDWDNYKMGLAPWAGLATRVSWVLLHKAMSIFIMHTYLFFS